MLKNLAIRAITGVIFVGVIIASIFLRYSCFAVLMLIFSSAALWELYKLIGKENFALSFRLWGLVINIFFVLSTYLYVSNYFGVEIFGIVIFFPLFVLVSTLYSKKKNVITQLSYLFFGILYITVPFVLLSCFYLYNNTVYWLLLFFASIWLYDTFAYLVGTALGKHRLMEHISPKKTWEGFIGGLILTLLCAYFVTYFVSGYEYETWKVLLFVFLNIIFGTWGDLFESMIKRNAHVKDSGIVLPGHGGILDRFDSVLFSAPIAFIFILLVN